MSTSREKLLAQFRELVTERLSKIGKNLMALEAGGDREAGKAALRELHGLKGEARMMGFAEINTVVHQMEELVRAPEALSYALQAGSVDALLASSDAVAVLAGATGGEPPEVQKLVDWLSQCIAAERARVGEAARPSPAVPPPQPSAPPAPPSSPRPPREAKADASIRISQQSLAVLTSAVTGLLQRSRRRELVGGKHRQLARELVLLHRLAEDLGPAGAELASRLGKAKELSSELNRTSTLVNTEELRDLTVLSEEIQSLRMLPLGVLFEQYPRMVRELSKELGKDVELVLEGEDERVDRTVLDALKDPLLHLVRNAVDHGLEPREERAAGGKAPRGTVRLVARRDGDRLVLRVEDDGRGLDPALLRQVAVRKGLLDEQAAAALTDLAATDLIFVSGFTSKERATDVSGRGVGLDVVRTRLTSVGGEVTVQSLPGRGAAFELRVPVSLTVAPVLFVQVGDDRLCLSAANVLRARHVDEGDPVELGGKPALKVDGEVLPFASMASVLGGAPERAASAGELVLVLRGRGQQAAVSVDRVLEERVQAILPLRGMLSRLTHLSGATPLADGTLAMVLSAAHLVATVHGREVRLASLPAVRAEARRRRVLVVDDSPLTRELLVSLLEATGYVVLQAHDGQDALEKLAREAVDLVVTDLEMPRVDGLALTRRLKSHATLRSLPVVIVTTRGSEADRRRGMEAGADGYVAKGDLVRQDLVDVVARLLA